MRQEAYNVTSPEEHGVPSEAIRQVIHHIRHDKQLDLHSFLMLRHGELIWEEYFRAGERDRLHALHSVSKSFTSTAIGLAQTEGLLKLDDKLYDFFPQHASLIDSEWKSQITLSHLLMMGSGFENNEGSIFGAQANNLVGQALAQPVIHQPGSHFNYYTLGSYLVSAIFSQVCPMGLHRYLRQRLFTPLGFGESQWNVDDDDIPFGGFGLFLTAYDLTRLGQLYLQDGVWQGQQILPSEYAQQATSRQITNEDNGSVDWCSGYGYQFWLNSFGGFRADGMHGQYIIVLPDQASVIVMTSHLDDMQTPLTAISTTLLPAMN